MQCVTCRHENSAEVTFCSACGSALDVRGGAAQGIYTPLLPRNTRLHNGAYAVGEVLGQGGFGITYKGGDLSLRRYVAIKEFFPHGCIRQNTTVLPSQESAADYNAVKSKFVEEARLLAGFSHPGIVRVFGVFQENNTAYMVMEFLEGKTLGKLIEESGALSEKVALSHIRAVADALEHVHASNLIHRDIKPDNICVTGDGRTVLIDFGTARAFVSGKTVRQTAMLTPGYAPLEQYGQQARFGSFTDVYALGATLYHCLTGQMPAPATDRIAGVDVAPPHQLNPLVSLATSQAVMHTLQIKATERPQNMREFLAELDGSSVPRPDLSPATTPHDILVCAAGSGDHLSIGDATEAAPEGATIRVLPGTYREGLLLQKSLVLLGAQSPGDELPIIEWDAGNVCKFEGGSGMIRGFEFRGVAGTAGKRFHALSASGGLWKLENCVISCDSLCALRVSGEANIECVKSAFMSERLDGISVEGGDKLHLKQCHSQSNGRHGLHQKSAPHEATRVEDAVFDLNRGCGAFLADGEAVIENSSLCGNGRAGIEVEEGTGVQLLRSRLCSNKSQGVIAALGASGAIEGCDVTGNRFGAFDVPHGGHLRRGHNKE